jgi:predicted RNA-binding protein YlqC (UPF0109 family)
MASNDMTPPEPGPSADADDDDEVLVGPSDGENRSGEARSTDARGADRPRGPRGGGGGGRRPGGPRRDGPRFDGPRGDRNAPRVSLAPLTKLVAHLAKALVVRPDQVEVREAQGDRFPRIELTVAPDDIGKVIGKDGRTAQCIRALLQAAAARAGVRAHLDIVD